MKTNIGEFEIGQVVEHDVIPAFNTGIVKKVNTLYKSITVKWSTGHRLTHPSYLLTILKVINKNNPNSTFKVLKTKESIGGVL
jgi:hypothetical protein